MYRESADPNTTHELHAVRVMVAKGALAVGLVATFAIANLALLVTLLACGAAEVGGFEAGVACMGALAAAVAFTLRRRRRKTLRIVQRGYEVRLVVPGTEIDLALPLRCHTAQVSLPVGRVSMCSVYLQVIDATGRSVMLHEIRPSPYGAHDAWDLPPLDRSVRSSTELDIGEGRTLANVRGWIEELNGPRKAA